MHSVTSTQVSQLRCESLHNPIGIEQRQPRFSWIMESDAMDVQQSAWQVCVYQGQALLWDSGKVISSESHHKAYAGSDLKELTAYTWTVTLWDAHDTKIQSSETASFVTSVFENYTWQGEWIRYTLPNLHPCSYMRRQFTVAKKIDHAYLIMSAKGIFDPYINGKRISDDYFMPGWTDYKKRQHYRVFDVTSELNDGFDTSTGTSSDKNANKNTDNCFGAILAGGWWSGQVGWVQAGIYGTNDYLLAELHITYEDGSEECIVSDDQWEAAHASYLKASIMHGEEYDARLELPDWSKGAIEGDWRPVCATAHIGGTDGLWGVVEPIVLDAPMHAHPGVAVKAVAQIQAQSCSEPLAGAYVYDFGQNMAGVVRLQLNFPAGTCARMRHAEMITPDGKIYVENLRSAQATDMYICKGGGEIYDPRFTFHGFRYLEISGIPEALDLSSVQAIALASDTEIVGAFSCSNAMLNQLQSNIQWTQRSNFLEVPTDCPQRDERLGWTGDAQVFIGTACANADVESFFRKWLNDMKDNQREDGSLSNVIPEVGMKIRADAAWGDAVTVCPTDLYTAYGDPEILREWLPMMKAFCDWCKTFLRADGTRGDTHCFGDWLALDAEDPTQCEGGTPKELIQTAFYALSCQLTAQAAAYAGDSEAQACYNKEHDTAAAAFNSSYFDGSGKSHCDTQTSYVLALHFNLLTENKRTSAIKNLVVKIHANNMHLDTGFVGVSYLLPCLAENGELALAYALLENKTFPSWGYSIENGATTIWERWNGWIKDQGPGDASMNSYSHYAYGSVGKFIYDTLAGLKPLEPGYAKASIAPYPGGSITQAEYAYDSIVGKWKIAWQQTDTQFNCQFTIPANSSAEVSLPAQGKDLEHFQINGTAANTIASMRKLRMENDRICFDAQSGNYDSSIA